MNQSRTTIETGATAADRDETLIAFVDAGLSADLAAWVRRYPESAGDFAHVAAARWAGASIGVAETPAEYDAADNIRAVGRETLASFRATREAASPVAGALTDLIGAAKARQLTPIALAGRLRVPLSVFVKLHRRLIAPDSIPISIVREMADALGRHVDEIANYFRLPPTLALGASYRSDSVPMVAEQESFAAALDADQQTTDEQLAFHSAG